MLSRIGKVVSATEELTAQILLPVIKERRIYACVEYDDKRETLYAKFRYGGERFDPMSSKNKLALTILNKQCAQTEYNTPENESYTNEVILHIK